MRNPFTLRRPWVALMIGLLLGPIIGMLYLGRARFAGLYLLLYLALLSAFAAVYPAGFGDLRAVDAIDWVQWPYQLLGATHVTYLAWRRPLTTLMPWYSRWYVVLGAPAAVVLALLGFCKLLFNPYYLPSESMTPTLNLNDTIFASRRSYDTREPARGDVIAVYSSYGNATYIKRIIGLPHDRVAIRYGAVILNGKPLRYTRVGGGDFLEHLPDGRTHIVRTYYGGNGAFDNVAEQTVPPGQYYVLGDYRDQSLDSRFGDFGFVSRQSIVGPVALKVFDGSTRRFVFQPIH